MRYARPQIRPSQLRRLAIQVAPPDTKSEHPIHIRRTRVLGITRSLALSLIVACQACVGETAGAQSPEPNWLPVQVRHPLQGMNRLGRLMGWGVSDGYHAPVPGKASLTHDLPPRSAWITEPVGFIEHPSTARILREIHDVNRNRPGFFDPYIDHSMVSQTQSLPGHQPYSQEMMSPAQTDGNIQPIDIGIGPGVWEVAPEPLPTNTTALPTQTPKPRNPREQVPSEAPGIHRQPSVLDTLPNPQLGHSLPPTLPLSPPTQAPSPDRPPLTQQPLAQPYASPVEGYSGTPDSRPRVPSQTAIPAPTIQQDPLSFPLIPEGTQDPLPQPQPPRGNLLPEPAVPPGIDPLDEFRRVPSEMRQTNNLPQQRIAPKRIPRITNRIVEPVSH